MTGAGDRTLIEYVRTVLTTPSPLERYELSPTRRAVNGDVVLLELGPAGERRRHVIALGAVTAEETFARAAAFYGDERVDSVELVKESAVALEADMLQRGWQMTEEEPALVLPGVPDMLPAPPHGLTVRRVDDDAGLEDFWRVSRTGRRYVPSVEAARDPEVALLVGYVGTEAVATARVSGHGEVSDLMGVVTLPAFRRRGYGLAMTWAAVGAARDMACGAYLLTATELGYPVYVKMGFVRVCTLRTYQPGEVAGGT